MTYDVAIIGSGIAGLSLACILAKNGQRVLVLEANSHPRFAIGESMILETSEIMRTLAQLFGVPELAYFSSENYRDYIGTSHGVKRHFGFYHHNHRQRTLDKDDTLQAVIPFLPHGYELHLYRQDSDAFLLGTAIAYGAEVAQNTRVESVAFGSSKIVLKTTKGDFSAGFVVDAAGVRSPLAHQLKLRKRNLKTRSRALFTHMIKVNLETPLDPVLPFEMGQGTIHHVFQGGWLWLIPFNNHRRSTNPLCSVGLLLDTSVHGEVAKMKAEEEFRMVLRQFPALAHHFREARLARDWVSTPRLQYSTSQTVGDRWALLGHSSGFVDPLYSKGLYMSLSCVLWLAHHLLSGGLKTRSSLLPLESLSHNFLRSQDEIVSASYRSWQSKSLWRPISVLWLLGAYTELVKLMNLRYELGNNPTAYVSEFEKLRMVGGGFGQFGELTQKIIRNLEPEVHGSSPVEESTKLLRQIDWLPPAFRDVLDGKHYLPKRKLRPSTPMTFLGNSDYREHFFGSSGVREIVPYFLRESFSSSRATLGLKRIFASR